MPKSKLLFVVSIFTLMLIVGFASAKAKTFIREYTHRAGDADSKITSRVIALEQVKRLLLEEVSIYLESELETRKTESGEGLEDITKQQIRTMSAGITQTEIIEEKWDGYRFYLKAKITLDPDDVIKKVHDLKKNRQKLKELEDLRKKSDEALAEIEQLRKEGEEGAKKIKAAKQKEAESNNEVERLKAELERVRLEKESLARQKDFQVIVDMMSAADYLNKSYNAAQNEDWYNAILYSDKAIELNPDYALAYHNRGNAKVDFGDCYGAIADYSKAIELDPEDVEAYAYRGSAKGLLGDNKGAIADYDIFIELDPENTEVCKAYHNRGVAKNDLGDNYGAIADYNKAIELDPEFASAYHNRGNAKSDLGDNMGAIEDRKKAARLGSLESQKWLRENGYSW